MSVLKYSLIAKAASIVFVLLAVYLLFGTIRNVLIEYRATRKRIKLADYSRIIGYAALTDEWQDEDAWRAIFEETVFGSSFECNFRITGHDLKGMHFRIIEERGRVYLERLCPKSDLLMVNDLEVRKRMRIRNGCKVYAGDAEILITLLENTHEKK